MCRDVRATVPPTIHGGCFIAIHGYNHVHALSPAEDLLNCISHPDDSILLIRWESVFDSHCHKRHLSCMQTRGSHLQVGINIDPAHDDPHIKLSILMHRFTYPKGVHSYWYFLLSNSFVICSSGLSNCIWAISEKMFKSVT